MKQAITSVGVVLLCIASGGAELTLDRQENWFIIRGAELPTGEIRVNYLEAFCRAGSTDADWSKHTVVGHKTETRFENLENKRIKLRSKLDDGLWVEHEIVAGDDEVIFKLTAYNTSDHVNEAHWAQPC